MEPNITARPPSHDFQCPGAVCSAMAKATPNSVAALTLLLLEVLLVSIALRWLYNLFLHPLRKFPGPIAHRASVLPIALRVALGRWTTELLPLTERFGPVVRVAPNELVFTDPDAWFVILDLAPYLVLNR